MTNNWICDDMLKHWHLNHLSSGPLFAIHVNIHTNQIGNLKDREKLRQQRSCFQSMYSTCLFIFKFCVEVRTCYFKSNMRRKLSIVLNFPRNIIYPRMTFGTVLLHIVRTEARTFYAWTLMEFARQVKNGVIMRPPHQNMSSKIQTISDPDEPDLLTEMQKTKVCCRLSPQQKRRLVRSCMFLAFCACSS